MNLIDQMNDYIMIGALSSCQPLPPILTPCAGDVAGIHSISGEYARREHQEQASDIYQSAQLID